MNRFKQKFKIAVTLVAAIFFASACAQNDQTKNKMEDKASTNNTTATNIDTATFGAGCFWCVEAVFQRLNGVISIESGYSGGSIKNPAYREVCMGTTGHAEVCRILFDKTKVSFD